MEDSFHVEVQVIKNIIVIGGIVLPGHMPTLDDPRQGVAEGNVNTGAPAGCFKCRSVASVVDENMMRK